VISVGNLVVGGSGKTPVVAALARLLRDAGMRPAVLSRGYARRTRSDGVVVVSDGERVLVGVDSSGDEPQMLARALPRVPVLVSPDRHLAGTLAIRQFDAGVLLLDDGFQHLQLERTVDLLLASPADVAEDTLPLGRLREPLAAARSADAVLVHGDAGVAEQLARTLGVGAAFTVAPRYGALRPLAAGPPAGNDGRVVAVAGIARPERFFTALREHGHEVVRTVTFGDHHWFTRKDLDRIATVARAAGATSIVTTEKDAMRLEPLVRTGRWPSSGDAARLAWSVLPLDVEIEPRDRFIPWLQARL
jgi:tetraacyldisaccharide 4'-kinase